MMKVYGEKIIKTIYYAVILATFVSAYSCNIVNVDKMPVNQERSIKYKIILRDNSGYMVKLFGKDGIRNAEIDLKSNKQGNEYKVFTDTNGVAEITGILSDDYFITANRPMSPDEMRILTGVSSGDIKLTNLNCRVISLTPAKGTSVTVQMDIAISNSPIVISEIYACGPPGSGLYYHDKYVEVYNQSDSVQYLDGLLIVVVYANYYLGIWYADDTAYVHTKNIWKFPGNGRDYPIQPGQFVVCAEDAIDHRINAPNSVDLSHADFEFYKADAPDVDNPNVPNMVEIYQDAGNDWLIGGESGAIVLSNWPGNALIPSGDQFLVPIKSVMDGVEYLKDPTQLSKKILSPLVDAGSTGSIQFYTGKSMERKAITRSPRLILKDDNNSSVDFDILDHPTPDKYH